MEKVMSHDSQEAPRVLIEGAPPGAAEFVAQWLLAAVEADQLLQREFSENPDFRKSIERLELIYGIAFAPPAMVFLTMWLNDVTAFELDFWSEWVEIFSVMADIGFFTLTGNRYQMTVPNDLKIDRIKEALLRLAATEDAEDYSLHPEWLLTTMTKQEASDEKLRLDRMGWERMAEREALLAKFSNEDEAA
jgi:hypothetical protein